MYIRKILLTLGIVIVASALVTMVSANGGLVSSSSAQGEQKFTAKMTGKEEVPPKAGK